jgi:ankyrin repeat protein
MAVLPLVADNAMLYASATLNGVVSGRMVIDTGSSVTTVAPETATKLDLHAIANKSVDTFTGSHPEGVGLLDQLTVGPLTLNGVAVLLCACPPTTLRTGERTIGTIGMDVLGRQPFSIDFRNRTLTLYDPATFVPPSGEGSPLQPGVETPRVRAAVEGHDGWFEIDTGYADTLLLTQPFAELNADLVVGRPQVHWGAVWADRADSYAVRWRSFDLMGLHVTEENGSYDASDRFGRRIAGLIGTPHFRDTILTIDMTSRRAWRQEPPPESLEALVARLRDVDHADPADVSPMYQAAMLKRADAVGRLLELGESPDRSGYFGLTPLMRAAAHGDMEIMDLLLAHGASVQAVYKLDDFTPLLFAARFGRFGAVKRLLEAGADVNRAASSGRTPLFLAAEGGHADVVRYLLERGVKVDQALKTGETPLLAACNNGDAAVAAMLLGNGADPNAAGTRGNCLSYASSAASVDCVKLLLQHRADPNARALNGPTPLMAAAAFASPEGAQCVRLLLNAGADASVRTRASAKAPDGKAAFDIAVERGHVGSVVLLRPTTANASTQQSETHLGLTREK